MRCPISPGEKNFTFPIFQQPFTRQQLISFLKNHGEFFKDRDFHQHVKMLFSGAEDVKEEEEHNEFFHIPEQVPILDVATLFG